MSTLQQRKANYANAQKSTGPKTPEGKNGVRLNALKHSLTSQILVVPEHLREAWQTFRQFCRKALRPVSPAQEIAADEIVDLRFRLQTISAMELRILSTATQNLDNHEIFDAGDPVLTEAITTAVAFEKELPSLNLLGLYESRIHRRLAKAEDAYHRLQAAHNLQANRERNRAIKIYKHLKAKGIDYDPEALGFVCSAAEIETWIRVEAIEAELRLPPRDDQNPPEDGKSLPFTPETEEQFLKTAS